MYGRDVGVILRAAHCAPLAPHTLESHEVPRLSSSLSNCSHHLWFSSMSDDDTADPPSPVLHSDTDPPSPVLHSDADPPSPLLHSTIPSLFAGPVSFICADCRRRFDAHAAWDAHRKKYAGKCWRKRRAHPHPHTATRATVPAPPPDAHAHAHTRAPVAYDDDIVWVDKHGDPVPVRPGPARPARPVKRVKRERSERSASELRDIADVGVPRGESGGGGGESGGEVGGEGGGAACACEGCADARRQRAHRWRGYRAERGREYRGREEEEEDEEDEEESDEDDDDAMRECARVGTGSKVLSAEVRGNILALMLGHWNGRVPGPEAHIRAVTNNRLAGWEAITAAVGARPQDAERVRHCAKGYITDLPEIIRRRR
ncbi:unnamed protein product [Cutaneotrichosporon oleaginosum]